MQVVHERCAGIDVHQRSVVVTALVPSPAGRVEKQTRMFGTMTADREDLARWLDERQLKQVAMESTGVYTLPTMLPKRSRNGSMESWSCIAPPVS